MGTAQAPPAGSVEGDKKAEDPPRRKKSRFAPPPTGAQDLAAGNPQSEALLRGVHQYTVHVDPRLHHRSEAIMMLLMVLHRGPLTWLGRAERIKSW